MGPRRLLLLSFLLIANALSAQSPPTATSGSQPSMQSLLDRIQQLENRINQLEERERKQGAAQAGAPTPTGPAEAPVEAAAVQFPGAPPAPPTAPVEEHGGMAEMRTTERHFPSLQIRGFGDVDFSATDQKGSISGFNLGQFVLHFASPLSEKVSYFGEVSFTAQPTSFELNVERSIIRYDYNDYFKISFGKYHTPIGYWNTAFHHGAWLQTTIARPEMVQFGGTYIPVHFVGVQAEGNIPSGWLGLGYNVGLGNGRGSVLSKSGDSGDVNSNRAWVANVYARPPSLYGLQVGASVYRDELTPQPGQNFRETISALDIVWTKEKPEFLAEVANVHHRNELTSATWNSPAFYAQVAYRLPWLENKWKPYYRYEYIHKSEADPTLVNVLDLSGSTLGVRYDITNFAAFKAEYRNSRHGVNEPRVNGAFFQTDFTF
jgi:hypothetical protein